MNIFYTYIFTQNDITLVLGSVAEYNVLYYRKSQEKSEFHNVHKNTIIT